MSSKCNLTKLWMAMPAYYFIVLIRLLNCLLCTTNLVLSNVYVLFTNSYINIDHYFNKKAGYNFPKKATNTFKLSILASQ